MSKFRKGSEASMYWGYVGNYQLGAEDREGNPDCLDEEDAVIGRKNKLTDDQEENLSAYYRSIARGALKELSPMERKVWKLRFFQWLTEIQISQMLKIRRETVYKYLERAGKKLKPIITNELKRHYGHFNIGFKKGVESKGNTDTDKEFAKRMYLHKEEIEKWKERHPEMEDVDK